MEDKVTASPDYYYAGFWPRFAAHFLDMAICGFFLLHIYYMYSTTISSYLAAHPDIVKNITSLFERGYSSSYSNIYELQQRILYYILVPYSILFPWIYYAGFESSYLRATPGKWLLGIHVTDIDGTRVTFGQASGRYFGKILSSLILYFGFIMIATTETAQGLHDKMSDCLVWRK